MTRLLVLLLAAAGCAPSGSVASPPAPLPIVELQPGQPDTLDVSAADDLEAEPPVGVRAERLPGGRLVLTADASFRGIALVGLGGGRALAVQGPSDRDLRLALVGPRPGDASVLDFRLAVAGGGELPDLEEEDALALWNDRPLSDNAYDVDVADGVLGVDLDAIGPEPGRLRVVVHAGPLVSNWVELELAGRRVATRPQSQLYRR